MTDADIDSKIRAIRGIAGLLMTAQKSDNDLTAAAEAIWDLAREVEEFLESQALEAKKERA
jgi:hypothetical protein